MILSDADIKKAIKECDLDIEPLRQEAIQPASVDLRLGRVFWRFRKKGLKPVQPVILPTEDVKSLMFRHDSPWVEIQPGEMMLGVTLERVTLSEWLAANVEGKSSVGRLGLSVHITAGFIDPGFSGYITLEMFNCAPFPIRLTAGMWIAQIKLQRLLTRCERPYGSERGSRYVDQHTAEPVTSRVHLKSGI